MNTQELSLKGLPYVPLDPQWLVECEAYHSDKPELVRAAVSMLISAWQNTPAGSVPCEFRGIARVIGLTEQQVGEHYDDLTVGWEIRGNRLHHKQMTALAERIATDHAEVLEKLADRAAAIIQSPEDFELTCSVAESVQKGKTKLSATFVLTAERRRWLIATLKVEDEGDQEFIFMKFRSHYEKNGEKCANWESAWHNFALKENLNYLPSRRDSRLVPLLQHGSSRVARWGGRGQQAEAHNAVMMAETVGERCS